MLVFNSDWCMMSIDCLTDLGMDDEGDDDPVPLPNVNAAILKKVQETDMPHIIHTKCTYFW